MIVDCLKEVNGWHATYRKSSLMSNACCGLRGASYVVRVARLSIADLGLWISDLRDWLDSRYRMLD